jgi:CPA2 family monovalent cation:H+ antiporter-2
MVLNESELSHAAAEDSLPLRDAFAVLFFVSVGMLFDPAIILDEPLALIGTVLVIVVGKSAAAWLIVRLFGHPAGTASTVAVSLGQIGEFSFILVGLAVSLEVMSGDARDLVLAGAILSIALNPLLFGLLDRRAAREAADAGEAELDAAEGHAIVVGHGRVGARVTAGLRERGTPVVVVEEDEDRAAAARAAGARVVRGNAASEDVLAAAAPARARLLVLAIPRPLEAGLIAQRVRTVAPDAVILARAHTDAEVAHLVAHGADRAIMAEQVLADALHGAALGDTASAETR